MSDLLPLFPLPNVVLFPNVFLALHIFEPRYRELVADALSADRMIGMVLLRPGWEAEYEGRPPVFDVGCSGVITHVERHTDGRYNIVLRGLDKFRILSEDDSRSYRRASVDLLPEPALAPPEREAVRRQRARLESLLGPGSESGGVEARTPQAMSDDDLVNALAQYLDFEPLEKQALLERPCLRTRAASLVELLEMKIITARTPGPSNVAH
ncbi:MAG: LON peptidase substrate-binding domain-containing protein [Acidobacteriia bacterium]|nr:LON peptidase substrate-binding domain-containing protein [Terriglobia bacterium]